MALSKFVIARHALTAASLLSVICSLLIPVSTEGCIDPDLDRIQVGSGESRGSRGGWSEKTRDNMEVVERKRDTLELILYGDSIMEDLADMGALRYYRRFYETAALGIGGDETPNLLYRITNGEFPDSLKPKAVAIMIGVNDIRGLYGCSGKKCTEIPSESDQKHKATEIADDVEQMAAYIHKKSCGTQIFVQAIIPTAYGVRNEWPNRYTDAINDANVQLRNMASKYETVHFVDCSDVFLEGSRRNMRIRRDRMEDLLHPDDEGHLSIAKCLLPRIQDVLGGGDDGSALQEEPCSRDSSADSSADSSSKPDVACE